MKGICFIEPLHNKTVEKIKIQTRRIVIVELLENEIIKPFIDGLFGIYHKVGGIDNLKVTLKPRYNIGDIIYLKEPYAYFALGNREPVEVYRYGKTKEEIESYNDANGCGGLVTDWKNKLFMPASSARYFIKITSVRAERLQDISNEDCIKEGITFDGYIYMNGFDYSQYLEPRAAYKALINKINGKNTWNNNPWVWVYDYELIDRKEVQP